MEAGRHREMKKAGIRDPFDKAAGVVISSYEFAARQKDELQLHALVTYVVFDEAHRLRMCSTRRTARSGPRICAERLRTR